MIKRPDGNHIITKKEYGAYIGSVQGFKEEVVIISDEVT